MNHQSKLKVGKYIPGVPNIVLRYFSSSIGNVSISWHFTSLDMKDV